MHITSEASDCELDDDARKENRAVQSFADLTSAQQIKIMKKREQTESFGQLRFLTLAGVFADASYGGNRNGVGYQIMDMKHQAAFHLHCFGPSVGAGRNGAGKNVLRIAYHFRQSADAFFRA